MGTTLLDVCNRALSRVGAARMLSMVDVSAIARAVVACFPSAPDWVLRSWRWTFAIKREALSNPLDASELGYAWRYALPADYLTWAPEFQTEPVVVEGGSVLSDQDAPLWFRYVSQVTDPSEWDAAFAEVLAWKLALEIQPELGPNILRTTLLDGFHEAVRDAQRSGAIEPVGRGVPEVLDRWLTSRL